MRLTTATILLSLVILVIGGGCDGDECEDCGPGVEEGYLFKRVTEDDLAVLAGIEGVSVDVCVTYQVLDIATGEMDTETVQVVEDCCCDL
ncbi:MAG: hypothetical protein ACE5HZ_07875 [Fidelibacterota bacterium]